VAGKRRRPSQGPLPPKPGGAPRPGALRPGSKAPTFGGYKKQDAGEFAQHAQQVKDVAGGRDIVESAVPENRRERRPAPFDREELQVVRSWVHNRPLEATSPAAAMVPYPRMWSTKRGRYSKFQVPGMGAFGLVRARPTF
jgi:hypothetical protein